MNLLRLLRMKRWAQHPPLKEHFTRNWLFKGGKRISD